MYNKPLVLQNNGDIFLLEWLDPDGYLTQELSHFCDLVKAPEQVHTFHLSAHSLWSAAAKGWKAEDVLHTLNKNADNEMAPELISYIKSTIRSFGTLHIKRENNKLVLIAANKEVVDRILSHTELQVLITKQNELSLHFEINMRNQIKKLLFDLNLFAIDSTNEIGEPLDININYAAFHLREYQREAAEAYLAYKDIVGGGVVMMPPNSGKTVVSLEIITKIKESTLIFVENQASANRWKTELINRTDIADDCIEIYNNGILSPKPITIIDYNKFSNNDALISSLQSVDWGFIIYDDAHRLPAPTFIPAVEIESHYKLALASTIERADQNGNVVFAVIGPKWYEVRPKILEKMGYQVPVTCIEVKVPLGQTDQNDYELTKDPHAQRKIAAYNSAKNEAVDKLISKTFDCNVIIVSYRRNLADNLGRKYKIPVIATTIDTENLVEKFNLRKLTKMVVTSVIERLALKHTDILVATSYKEGSAREEYFRVGKLMEADGQKKRGYLFSLVSKDTIEERDYVRRRRALINYGYRYQIHTLKTLDQIGGFHES